MIARIHTNIINALFPSAPQYRKDDFVIMFMMFSLCASFAFWGFLAGLTYSGY
jgi:hypothetical protein